MPTLTTDPTLPNPPTQDGVTIHVGPPPDIGGGALVNNSGISFDFSKLPGAPPDLYEVPPYKEEWDEQGELTGLTRTFRVSWRNRPAARDLFLGYNNAIGGPGGGLSITRTTPLGDPEFPWLYASHVAVTGEGAWAENPTLVPASKIAFFDTSRNTDQDTAVLSVTFRERAFEVRTDAELAALQPFLGERDRWVERSEEAALDRLPLASGIVRFTPNGVSVGPNHAGQALPAGFTAVDDNAAAVLLPRRTLKFLWRDVPGLADDTWAATVGHTNAADWVSGRGFPTYKAGTLLFLPPQRKRHRDCRGKPLWDIEYTMLQFPFGVNNLPAADGEYYPVSYKKTGDPIFPTADYEKLFTITTNALYQ